MLQCKPPCYLDLKSWVDEEVMTGFLNLASTWQTTQEKSNIVAKLEIYTCQTKLFSDAAAEDYIKAIRRPNSIQEFIEMSEHYFGILESIWSKHSKFTGVRHQMHATNLLRQC